MRPSELNKNLNSRAKLKMIFDESSRQTKVKAKHGLLIKKKETSMSKSQISQSGAVFPRMNSHEMHNSGNNLLAKKRSLPKANFKSLGVS